MGKTDFVGLCILNTGGINSIWCKFKDSYYINIDIHIFPKKLTNNITIIHYVIDLQLENQNQPSLG